MQELLAQIMLLNSETSDRSADPDADSLRLTTVHQAKGLEYAAVFLIGLADGSFPLRRAIEAGQDLRQRRAHELMKVNPRTIDQDALAAEAADLMEQHRVSCLLVLDHQGHLCGALNTHDLMRAKVI